MNMQRTPCNKPLIDSKVVRLCVLELKKGVNYLKFLREKSVFYETIESEKRGHIFGQWMRVWPLLKGFCTRQTPYFSPASSLENRKALDSKVIPLWSSG